MTNLFAAEDAVNTPQQGYRLAQAAKFSDVVGSVITVQANIGQGTPGAAFGGALQKVVEVLLAQEVYSVPQPYKR